MWPIGFLDDDAWMRHRKHHGLAVLGTVEDLGEVAQQTDVRTVVIAIPSASAELVKRVSDAARGLQIGVKVLPPLHETFSADVDIKHVRDIEVRDLLGRPAIETDVASIAGYLTGKRVLVTGAGGSIGSELCRQIDRSVPAELIMLDRDESALHAVQLSICAATGCWTHPTSSSTTSATSRPCARSSWIAGPRSSSTPRPSSTCRCSSSIPSRR